MAGELSRTFILVLSSGLGRVLTLIRPKKNVWKRSPRLPGLCQELPTPMGHQDAVDRKRRVRSQV